MTKTTPPAYYHVLLTTKTIKQWERVSRGHKVPLRLQLIAMESNDTKLYKALANKRELIPEFSHFLFNIFTTYFGHKINYVRDWVNHCQEYEYQQETLKARQLASQVPLPKDIQEHILVDMLNVKPPTYV
jgi:hypothetical protein